MYEKHVCLEHIRNIIYVIKMDIIEYFIIQVIIYTVVAILS